MSNIDEAEDSLLSAICTSVEKAKGLVQQLKESGEEVDNITAACILNLSEQYPQHKPIDIYHMVVHNRDSLLNTNPLELIIRAVDQKFPSLNLYVDSNDEDNSDMESVTDSVSKTTIKRTSGTASLSTPNKGKPRNKPKIGGGGLKTSADDKPVSNNNNELHDVVVSRIGQFQTKKKAKLTQNIMQMNILLLHQMLQDNNAVSSGDERPEWVGDGKIDKDIRGKFNTSKINQANVSNNIKTRISSGRQLKQDDSLEHKSNLATYNYLGRLVENDFTKRVYPHQPPNLESMLHKRDGYNKHVDVHYVNGYPNGIPPPKPGETADLDEREKYFPDETPQPSITAVVGTSAELRANGYVNEEVLNEVIDKQTIGQGYDDNAKATRITMDKATRQIAEGQSSFGYNCKSGSVLEHTLSFPSQRLRKLTNGEIMLKLMGGSKGIEIMDYIKKYHPNGTKKVVTRDTWPKTDDILNKIEELVALIHKKNEKGGVTPYLCSLLVETEKYIGLKDCNECPFIELMKEIESAISDKMEDEDDSTDSTDSTTDDEILELLGSFKNATKPYFAPTQQEYADGAIASLDGLAEDESIDPKTTLIDMRYSNIDAIKECNEGWFEENLEPLMVIPGSKVDLDDGRSTIKASDMRLVAFQGKYLLLVRGSSFLLFDTKQARDDALQYSLQYVDEAVFKYCIGLQSVEGLEHVLRMMQSYAMLIVGPSGSVTNPTGSVYDAVHLLLPPGMMVE